MDALTNTQIGPGSFRTTSAQNTGQPVLANSNTPATVTNTDLNASVKTPATIDSSKLIGGTSGGNKDVSVPAPSPDNTNALVNSLVAGNPQQGLVPEASLQNDQNNASAAVDQTSKQINDLMTQLGYKASDTASLQNQANISGLQSSVNDLNSVLAQKKSAYDQQFQNIGSQNIPSLFVSGQMALARAAAASDLGATAAQLQAAQGNLTSAFNTINQTITQKYQPIIDQISAQQKFYDMNFEKMTNAQQKLATRQSQILGLQQTAITNQQKILGDAATSVNDAIKNGMIDPQTGWSVYSDLLSGKITASEAFAKLGLKAPSQVTQTADLASAISSVESGGSYTATNPSGALGKYQIMPKYWFATIGLDPNSTSDQQKFLNTPSLQDNLFQTIISTLTQKYDGDQGKAIAAYFGGDPAAKAYGTPAGDKISDGNMSVNQYVNKVLGNLNSATANSTDGGTATFLAGKTPEQVQAFNSMSPVQQSNVQNLVTGGALLNDLITSKGMAGQIQRQKLIADAQKIDPTFNENQNKIRYNYNKDWNDSTTTVGKTKLAINTALNHLADVSTAAQALTPSDLQVLNKTKNWWDAQTGNPAITNLQFGITQLATEIATAYKGGAPSEGEIENEKAVLGAQFSKSQLQGVLNTAGQFLSGKISSLNYQYKSTMGTTPPQPVIDPAVRTALTQAGIDPNAIVKDPNSKLPNGVSEGSTVVYQGKTYNVDAQGNMTPQ